MRRRKARLVGSVIGRRPTVGGTFSAADILMTHVLRDLRHTTIVADYPKLAAYLARCEARPAFQRALADQLAPFRQAEARQPELAGN